MPDPLRFNGPEWIVITPQNAETIWAELKKRNIDLVLFAVTDEGYKQLSLDYTQVRNLIDQQRTIIIKYKEYYESNKEKEKSLLERYFKNEQSK